jgi:hypothetical protein
MREVCALGGMEAGALVANNEYVAGHGRYSATLKGFLRGAIHIAGR